MSNDATWCACCGDRPATDGEVCAECLANRGGASDADLTTAAQILHDALCVSWSGPDDPAGLMLEAAGEIAELRGALGGGNKAKPGPSVKATEIHDDTRASTAVFECAGFAGEVVSRKGISKVTAGLVFNGTTHVFAASRLPALRALLDRLQQEINRVTKEPTP